MWLIRGGSNVHVHFYYTCNAPYNQRQSGMIANYGWCGQPGLVRIRDGTFEWGPQADSFVIFCPEVWRFINYTSAHECITHLYQLHGCWLYGALGPIAPVGFGLVCTSVRVYLIAQLYHGVSYCHLDVSSYIGTLRTAYCLDEFLELSIPGGLFTWNRFFPAA